MPLNNARLYRPLPSLPPVSVGQVSDLSLSTGLAARFFSPRSVIRKGLKIKLTAGKLLEALRGRPEARPTLSELRSDGQVGDLSYKLLSLCLLWAVSLTAQPMNPSPTPSATAKPVQLKDVGLDQKLNAQVPLELTFRNEAGQTVRLGQYFKT